MIELERSFIERRAIRAVLLTTDAEVLLLRIRSPEGNLFWITPGGGLDDDETDEAALQRELREELGLEGFELGPLVWRRHHTFNWGEKRLSQREHYHMVRVPTRFEPRMSDAAEAAWLDRFRWWSLAQLRDADEPVAPRSLHDIVARYLRDGPPAELPDWEILVD